MVEPAKEQNKRSAHDGKRVVHKIYDAFGGGGGGGGKGSLIMMGGLGETPPPLLNR